MEGLAILIIIVLNLNCNEKAICTLIIYFINKVDSLNKINSDSVAKSYKAINILEDTQYSYDLQKRYDSLKFFTFLNGRIDDIVESEDGQVFIKIVSQTKSTILILKAYANESVINKIKKELSLKVKKRSGKFILLPGHLSSCSLYLSTSSKGEDEEVPIEYSTKKRVFILTALLSDYYLNNDSQAIVETIN